MASGSMPDDRSVLAAELALGLLDGDSLVEARALERDDPGFASEVKRWTSHFELMFAQWPSRAPSPALERRVRAAAGIGAANDNDATRWKWATGAASAVAAALALAMLVPGPMTPPPGPTPVDSAPRALAVAFSVEGGTQAVPAMVDLTHRQIRMPRGLAIPAGRVAQLWLIEGEDAPKPIGLFEPIPTGLAATLTLNRDLPAGAVLAISIEPPGGSPTGLPTGPVVATGQINPV